MTPDPDRPPLLYHRPPGRKGWELVATYPTRAAAWDALFAFKPAGALNVRPAEPTAHTRPTTTRG